MKEFDVVEIVQLIQSDRPYDGTAPFACPPCVGDTGSIVHIYIIDGEVTGYMVEDVDVNGNTIWLADFLPEEIKLVNAGYEN